MYSFDTISKFDPEIAEAIDKEINRQRDNIELIASENFVSEAVIAAMGSHFDLIVVSSVMPMVPGVAITNAIRDTLHGDLISGVARTLDAFIVAASIAAGVGIVLSLLIL